MIGLATTLLVLIVACTAATIEFANAYEHSKEIRLQNIQTPEQVEIDEKVKTQWLADFSQLLNESSNDTTDFD